MALTDPGERKAYMHKYYLANREKFGRDAAAEKRYREANPEAARARTRRSQDKLASIVREAKNVPCIDCGGEYPPWVMDLDHVYGEKSFSIGVSARTKSRADLLAEIEKCEVVCANCHRERHEVRRRGGDA